LQTFNREYRRRRLQSKRRGETFMTYSEALRRLRALLAKSVAAGGVIPPSFIKAVFDQPERARPSLSARAKSN
jgi:hypothetical protein